MDIEFLQEIVSDQNCEKTTYGLGNWNVSIKTGKEETSFSLILAQTGDRIVGLAIHLVHVS